MENNKEIAGRNWATNIQFQAANFEMPKSIEQLQEIVHKSEKVRVVGAGHSFNNIANTTGTLISLDGLEKYVEIDYERRTATFHGGMTYADIAPVLHDAGYGLPNLSSTPQTTVIGSCMTGTHGSGDGNKILADQISSLEMVNAKGELVLLSKSTHGEKFNGIVVSLGGLGIVTKVTLDLVPTYSMQHEFYRQLPISEMVAHFDEMMASGYSVSLGSRWQSEMAELALIRRKLTDGQTLPVSPTFFGATLIGGELFDNYPMERITFQENGVAAPWYERLPFFNIRTTINGENERQSEYFVRRENGFDALMAVKALGKQMASFIKITEIRTIAADDIWLSPAYQQDCVAIHFSWLGMDQEINRFLPTLEKALAPFNPRPHWGKMFMMPPTDVQACYPQMANFQTLLGEFDPKGKFLNDYLAKYITT